MIESTDTDVDRACRAAERAAAEIAEIPHTTRASWLRAIADDLDSHVPALVEIAETETGLTPARLTGEVARTTAQLRLFALVVEEGSFLEATIDHPRADATPPIPDLRRLLRPVGPVAVFAASNFPFAFSVAGGDTASALAVGCSVVVKAHPGHPETAQLTANLVRGALDRAGAPTGTFGLVFGVDAGLALVAHPAVRAVGFTGSVRGGRALLERATARPDPIPFHGELGSLNPVIVTVAADDARGAELARGLAGSFQLGGGQFCTKPGLVFVPEGSALEKALPPHLAPQTRMLTPAIATSYTAGASDALAVPGVSSLVARDSGEHGTVVAVTDADTLLAARETLLEEVFGPFTLLVRYRDQDQLSKAVGALAGTLTATLHGEASEDLGPLARRLEQIAGRVLFDGWPTGVAVSWAQHHGGPWPSTTSTFTSVGATAGRRFQRPVAYQDAPNALLPAALREDNPLGIPRRVDGRLVVS